MPIRGVTCQQTGLAQATTFRSVTRYGLAFDYLPFRTRVCRSFASITGSWALAFWLIVKVSQFALVLDTVRSYTSVIRHHWPSITGSWQAGISAPRTKLGLMISVHKDHPAFRYPHNGIHSGIASIFQRTQSILLTSPPKL